MSSEKKEKLALFPVGPAGKRELKRALVRSKDPPRTIQTFQQSHSLHAMMATAFGTLPIYEASKRTVHGTAESLDTDSVMTFLHHMGVSQYEVHKRVSDTLLKQLEDELRKAKSEEPLLELLKSCWTYATTISELRPVLWAVLKKLGVKTPLPVLNALGERDEDGKLKHEEIFRPLPSLLKRLCWEADWESRVPVETAENLSAADFLLLSRTTLLSETVKPFVDEYRNNPALVDAANRPFVATTRERRVLTTQRRALTQLASNAASGTAASTTLLRGATGSAVAASNMTNDTPSLTSGKAVAQLRNLLSDTVGTVSSYRPKLLYAFLSILMAEHGTQTTPFLGCAEHLHCTLVADVLLSTGGPLNKAYQHLLTLARNLDDCVQEGNITDKSLVRIQKTLIQIFELENEQQADSPAKNKPSENKEEVTSGSIKRQLNRIITAGLNAMKEADPQNLFLNPVTDAIAPGYSRIISKPMCIVAMEGKVEKNEYNSLNDWELDVKLMFKNCIDYNRGEAGQWFRGEARRQGKIFREEVFPQARRLYQGEVAKRAVTEESTDRKRSIEPTSEVVTPLPVASKKRKKEKEEYLPSMQALASMLIADPFFVRVILARVLREFRWAVVGGSTIPIAHSVIPSCLQLLHMARWSIKICALRGKKYFVPGSGIEIPKDVDDPALLVPSASLRKCAPLLIRLLLESEFDKRVGVGGDLYLAAQAASIQVKPLKEHHWTGDDQMQVALALVEGSLVHICRPGLKNELSLSVTFPKFAIALQHLSPSLKQDRVFFQSLIEAIMRHKSKLPKPTRDVIVRCWLDWLRSAKDGSSTSPAHECFVMLLNDWSSLGNLLLPRDTLLEFLTDGVSAVNSSESSQDRKFASLWISHVGEFESIKKQYEKLLKQLPSALADKWKASSGIHEIVSEDQTGDAVRPMDTS